MRVLGIETSCDETGIAIFCERNGLLAHRVHSQIDVHAYYGGVVPELASRDHVRYLRPLVDATLKASGILGGVMRLLFSTEPNEEGARDVLVQCVGMFSTSAIHHPGPGEHTPFPTADIVRKQQWKHWAIPEQLQPELDTLSAHWKAQGNQAEAYERPTTLIDSMLRYDFNASERHSILWNATDDEVKTRFSEAIRFKALIVQQMQLKHRGQFPN